MHLASEPPVTVVLQKLIEKNFPTEYSRRKAEMNNEIPHEVTWSLPLFPLKHVAFPGMTFPLHIFEPKYRLMIRRCMAGSRCFGIVNVHLSPNGSWVPYNVGCMVSISKTTILMDGRSIIHCKGLKRFRIEQKWDQDGYLVGRVECFDDNTVMAEELDEFIHSRTQARQLVSDIMRNDGRLEGLQKLLAQAGDIPTDDVQFSFWMSSLLPISPEHKQDLLETASTAKRFMRLLHIIERVLQVLTNSDPTIPAIAVPSDLPPAPHTNNYNTVSHTSNGNDRGDMMRLSHILNGNADGDGSDGQSGADGDGDGVGNDGNQGACRTSNLPFAGMGQTFESRRFARNNHHNAEQGGEGQTAGDGNRPRIGQSRVGSGSCYAS